MNFSIYDGVYCIRDLLSITNFVMLTFLFFDDSSYRTEK